MGSMATNLMSGSSQIHVLEDLCENELLEEIQSEQTMIMNDFLCDSVIYHSDEETEPHAKRRRCHSASMHSVGSAPCAV